MDKTIYNFFALLPFTLLLASCAKQAYYIDTHTSRNAQGDYVVQWQVNPGMEGQVAIYASQNANVYPDQPNAIEAIEKEIYRYSTPQNTSEHTYFLLVFNNRDIRVVSSRTIPTIGIINLRDVGGYMTALGDQMRWGMLYTSGDLWRSFEQDIPTIASLGIHTQYILVPSDVADYAPSLGASEMEQIFISPDSVYDYQKIIDRIYNGDLSGTEVRKIRQNILENIAFNNPNQITMILDELIDPNKYPILLSDNLGRDRVAIVTFIVHHILGISKSDAISDYMINNDNLPPSRLEPNGFMQTTKVQEALTEYFRSQPNQINQLIDAIIKRYGSVDKYITEHLHFNTSKQEKLRNILLY